MIIDLILVVLNGFLGVFLSVLTPINILFDFLSSIPVVAEFLSIVAYVLPWTNILPIVVIVVAVFGFRIAISIIKTIWHFIPILGN